MPKESFSPLYAGEPILTPKGNERFFEKNSAPFGIMIFLLLGMIAAAILTIIAAPNGSFGFPNPEPGALDIPLAIGFAYVFAGALLGGLIGTLFDYFIVPGIKTKLESVAKTPPAPKPSHDFDGSHVQQGPTVETYDKMHGDGDKDNTNNDSAPHTKT